MSPSFASSSRSKRSLGINAKTDEGRRLLLALVAGAGGSAGCDVVVENGSTGVMDDLGLGYRHFAAVNPDVTMVSSQLMGSSGPWSVWRGYGPQHPGHRRHDPPVGLSRRGAALGVAVDLPRPLGRPDGGAGRRGRRAGPPAGA